MALLTRKVLFESSLPLFQAKRLRSKINIQKPRAPHHEKAKFLMLTEPIYINPNKNKHPVDLCQKLVQDVRRDEDNPFQRIIAGELLRWFQSSRLIVFFHMNPMSADDQFNAFAQFKKQNMHFKSYGKSTMQMALKGTPYEAALELYISRNMTVFSPEPEIKKLLKVTKKYRQLILLAAIYEGKFISKDELLAYSLIPDLKTAQAGLVQTLNSIGGHLVGQLTTHQNTLVNHLQNHMEQLEKK